MAESQAGTDLTAVWAEVWAVCAGQDKTPGETWAGAHGTAGLSLDTDQGSSTTPVSAHTVIHIRQGEAMQLFLLSTCCTCMLSSTGITSL